MSFPTEQHIASVFDRDLEAIQAHIMKMGGLVEAQILSASKSLEERDEELATKVHLSEILKNQCYCQFIQ